MSAPAKPSIEEIREALTVFGDSAESAGVRYEQGDRLGRRNAEDEGKQARGVVMDAIDELAAARERIADLERSDRSSAETLTLAANQIQQLRADLEAAQARAEELKRELDRRQENDANADHDRRLMQEYQTALAQERDAARAELGRYERALKLIERSECPHPPETSYEKLNGAMHHTHDEGWVCCSMQARAALARDGEGSNG